MATRNRKPTKKKTSPTKLRAAKKASAPSNPEVKVVRRRFEYVSKKEQQEEDSRTAAVGTAWEFLLPDHSHLYTPEEREHIESYKEDFDLAFPGIRARYQADEPVDAATEQAVTEWKAQYGK